MLKSGVYLIRNAVNNKVYVGSAAYITSRWSNHRARLGKGNHHSIKLQRAWNKYGAEAFRFLVLIRVSKEQLIAAEQQWIDHFKAASQAGYNVSPKAGSAAGRIA